MSAKVEVDLAGIERMTLKAAIDFVKKGQGQAQRELFEMLGEEGGSRTGKVYERYKPRRTIRSSAPGEVPQRDEGTLRQSVVPDTIKIEGKQVIGRVGIAAPYAEALEYGTERMEPRPMVGTLVSSRDRLDRIEDKARKAFDDAA